MQPRLVLSVIIACVFVTGAEAQRGQWDAPPVSYPKLRQHSWLSSGFVPWGWKTEYRARGDLNGDGITDVVLVLRQTSRRNIIIGEDEEGDEERIDTNPRILAVAFAGTGGYDLALENHTLVPRVLDPGMQDPLDPNGAQAGGVSIRQGALRVTLGRHSSRRRWMSGRTTFTFRHRRNRFELIGYYDTESRRGSDANEVSVDFLTGQMQTRRDDGRVIRTKLPRRELLTIEEVGDGLEFRLPSK
jgi:hypothetical protein